MLTMLSQPELPQQQNILDMVAITFVVLSRLCHESHVIPLLDFRLGSYEPHRKFATYFVGAFCSNVECILSCVCVGDFQHISEIYDIFCMLFFFQLRVYFVVNIYRKLPIYIGNLRHISWAFLFQLIVFFVIHINIK